MKGKNQPHWAMLEIAEKETPGSTINLWPRVKAQVASSVDKGNRTIMSRMKKQIAFGFMLALLLIGSLFFVPAVRAFAEDVIQRMGIAFVDTRQFDENVMVEKAEMIKVTPPPSLSVEEIREQISFPLMLPTWLPEGLNYVHRSISEYDPQSWEGSGKKLSIIYARTPDQDFTKGLLYLNANDGPISAPPLLAESREQSVTVNGQPGIYVHGGWQDDGRGDPNTKMGILQWDDQADDAYLTWTQDGVTYLLEAHNLGADLDVLLRIAESMTR
ncbi:MAG: hypothetical protein ROW48_04830 [Bellilinea sp.]|jgi:hypothetical protein